MTERPDSRAERTLVSPVLVALEHLIKRVDSEAGVEETLDAYFELRRRLVARFKPLTRATIEAAVPVMQAARDEVLNAMRASFGAAAPDEVLFVRSYGDVHLLLLGYLVRRLGRPVPASRLRFFTGEQVHTERRLRELRDLGYAIKATVVADEQNYVLLDSKVNAAAGAIAQLRANVRNSRRLGAHQKQQLLEVVSRTGNP